tara:strand:+ start:202 stop:639 length:438 start_codon:yes stop_codon:yes gene_type:complete
MKNLYLILEHLPLTILICIIAFLKTAQLEIVFFVLIFGWLLDIDHIIDYSIYLYRNKKIKISLIFFFSGKYFKKNKKIFVFLHSYEIPLFLNIIFYSTNNYEYIFVSISYLVHILQDQFTNNVKPFSYFLTYRLLINFDLKKICR